MGRSVEQINAYKMQWAKENKDKVKKAAKDCYLKHKDKIDVYRQTWLSSPRGKFQVQRSNALRRKVPWELTFAEWWGIWEDSGKWELRGAGKYMMCRHNDIGPYKVGNVRIDSHQQNVLDRKRNNIENQS